jgi:hypothetical protein
MNLTPRRGFTAARVSVAGVMAAVPARAHSPRLAGALLLLLAGCAPGNIVRSSCESVMLATGDPWSCTLRGDIVGQASLIEFTTESRNQIADVNLELRVTKGTLRVGYADLSGSRELRVMPSAPAALVMRTRMHRDRRSFSLNFEPLDGAVEGLTGTVKYATP